MLIETVLRMMQHNYRLTNREAEILGFVLLGNGSSKKIAEELNISTSTANTYLESLSRKIGFHGRSVLVGSVLQGLNQTVSPLLFPEQKALLPRVGIIDDDEDLTDLLRKSLLDHGLRLTPVRRFEDPVPEVDVGRFEVVLCDLVLPLTDGVKAARRIVDGASRAPCLILITGCPEFLDKRMRETLRGIFASVMLKPIEIEELVPEIWAATVIHRIRYILTGSQDVAEHGLRD